MNKAYSPWRFLLEQADLDHGPKRPYAQTSLENRSSIRYPVVISAKLERGDPVVIVDLSQSGLTLAGADNLQRGERHGVELPGTHLRLIDVIWNEGFLTGCCFTDILRSDLFERLVTDYGRSDTV